MGIQPAPQLANIWMSCFDNKIKRDSKFYVRYMDDILTNTKKEEVDKTLETKNNLHQNLKFTRETENNQGKIAFLDMLITHRTDGYIETEWFRKKTDTGLTINYHALAPSKYKCSMIINLIHWVWNATSTWENFDKGMNEAREILDYNQYPVILYENIIYKTLEKLKLKERNQDDDKEEKKLVFIEYRGKVTDHFAQKLRETGAPIKPILTLRKVKSAMPSLKAKIERVIASNIIYEFQCPNSQVSYVGMTSRHFCTRINEHLQNGKAKSPILEHTETCLKSSPTIENFKTLYKTHGDIKFLSVLEALFIREIEPTLNTKEEFLGRMLRIKV